MKPAIEAKVVIDVLLFFPEHWLDCVKVEAARAMEPLLFSTLFSEISPRIQSEFFICKPNTPIIVIKFTPCSFYTFGCETRAFKSNSSTCWETIWMIRLSHSLLNFQWTDDFINKFWKLWWKSVRMLVDILICMYILAVNILFLQDLLAKLFSFWIYHLYLILHLLLIHFGCIGILLPSIRLRN